MSLDLNLLQQDLDQLSEELRKTSSKVSSQEFPNLKIYQFNYQMTHILQIKYVYECIQKVIGPQNLSYFALKYLQQYPPKAPNLDLYGDQFPEFLKSKEIQAELKILPYLPDLAALDWMFYNESSNDMDSGKAQPAGIQVAKGTLKLWGAIRNGEPTEGVEIDLDLYELVMLHNITYQK